MPQEDNNMASQNEDIVRERNEATQTQSRTPTAAFRKQRNALGGQRAGSQKVGGGECRCKLPAPQRGSHRTLRPLLIAGAHKQRREKNKVVVTQSASPGALRRSRCHVPSVTADTPPSSVVVRASEERCRQCSRRYAQCRTAHGGGGRTENIG